MRKVMGAYKRQLIGQHLTESWLIAIFSLLLALIWIELVRPMFESMTGKPIVDLYSFQVMALLFGIASAVGIVSGFYPAFMLSSFKPVEIMKGQLKTGTKGIFLRKSLVVVQYAITILLVVGIMVVQQQLKFMQQHDLGFDKEGLLVMGVNGSQEVITGYEAFAQEVKSMPSVAGVTRSNTSLAGGLSNSVAVVEDVQGNKVNATVHRVRTDFDYLNVYGMQLLAGRFFQKDNAADSTLAFVVNERLIQAHGYSSPEDIIGKSFRFQGRDGQVTGVVKDFNYNSLQYSIDPTVLYLLNGGFSQITVRLTGNSFQAREAVEYIWKRHFPNTIVDTRFAEESLNAQYDAEQRFASVFLVFSVISLALACLGLFALVSYSVESRTKEIGIRKVLGHQSLLFLVCYQKNLLG